MGSFIRLSSSSPHLSVTTTTTTANATPNLSASPLIPTLSNFKMSSSVCRGRITMLPAKCLPGPARESARSSSDDAEMMRSPSPPPSPSEDTSMYMWSAALGGLGLLETTYLTYLKLSDSEAFCPVGGGSCGDVLNSDYSLIFGVPLTLIGMISYGFVVVLGLQLARKQLPFRIDQSDGRLILFSTTASMAAASAYFLYLLTAKFEGTSCLYCLTSAALSFTLFFTSLKDIGSHSLQKKFVLPLLTVASVLAILSTSYSYIQPISLSLAEVDLPFYSTEVTTESSPLAISLAKHLHAVGAKMYGAFWCSHCLEQKQMFGREAVKLLDYVECFPGGYRKGVKIEKACSDARVEGFPTWVINGKVLSGEQDLEELARESGFQRSEIIDNE